MSIWHILISESVSLYGRYVVGLLLVWVRDCRSAVGYNSGIVLMIGFQLVSCRLSIGPKSGDSIPNLTRNDPDMNPTGFTVSSATLSVADSWPIHWKFCGSCRFRVGLTNVTGVLGINFSEIVIGIKTFSFKKMPLNMSSAKWRPFCLGLNTLSDMYAAQYIHVLMRSQ